MALKHTQVAIDAANGDIDWSNDNFNFVFFSGNYTPDASHAFLSSISAGDRIHTEAVVNKQVLSDGFCDCDDFADVNIPGSVAVAGVALVKDTGVEGTSTMCFSWGSSDDADFPFDPSAADPIPFNIPAGGLFKL